jgi:alpha-L-rhamnosidase
MDAAYPSVAQVWDSGVVTSNDSVAVRYGGTALTSDTDYRWSVTWWDDQGVASEPSSSTFSIALLEVSVLQTRVALLFS